MVLFIFKDLSFHFIAERAVHGNSSLTLLNS